MTTILHIKNMVCPRCIEAVESILADENLDIESVELGKAVLKRELSEEIKSKLEISLKERGFELLKSRDQIIIEEIKAVIVKLIHHSGEMQEHLNFSNVISQKLNSDYKNLSSLFSSVEGITIERFVILQKVERIKELISYNEMNLSEIADYLGYSSVSHMSSQFKNQTGITPSQYVKMDTKGRATLDKIHQHRKIL